MSKQTRNLILLSVLFLTAVFYYNTFNNAGNDRLGEILSSISNSIRFASRIEPILSKNGIILWTNLERRTEKLPFLLEDEELNLIAEKRLEDMFTEQYFAHYSPTTNQGAEDEAEDIDYQFISIGENLAEGYFKDDQALVKAWMESPGHRKNILEDNYTKIGAAVKKGIFEGQKTWMAIQVFSKPLSECPEPRQDQKFSIENKKKELELSILRSGQLLKEMAENSKKGEKVAYNQKVLVYNEMINEINLNNEELERLITSYNNQVRSFNLCLQS